MRLMTIKGFRVGALLKKTAHEVSDDNIGTLAASAAYNFFFSLFPLLLFLAPLLSLVGDKQQMIGWITGQFINLLPAEEVPAVQRIITGVVFATNAPGLMSIGLILAAWSGSNIFGTLMSALNTAYDVRETRSWIRQQAIRLFAFALGGGVIVLSTVIFLKGEAIADWLGHLLGLGAVATMTWKVVQLPIAFAGLCAIVYLIFTLLPNVEQKSGQALASAVLTAALWVIATLLFRLYIDRFPPNAAYGLIGVVIILLTWMYYTMFVLLVGGELASEMHHASTGKEPDLLAA